MATHLELETELGSLTEMIDAVQIEVIRLKQSSVRAGAISFNRSVQELIQNTVLNHYLYEFIGSNKRLEVWDTRVKKEDGPRKFIRAEASVLEKKSSIEISP